MTESTTPRTYDAGYLSHYLHALAKEMTLGDPEAAGVLIRASQCISEGISTWIACAERNPKERGLYLVYQPSFPEPIHLCRFGTSQKWDNGRDKCKSPENRITHWMPLPEAPK